MATKAELENALAEAQTQILSLKMECNELRAKLGALVGKMAATPTPSESRAFASWTEAARAAAEKATTTKRSVRIVRTEAGFRVV